MKDLNVIKVIQNKILRAILFGDICTPLSTLYKSLELMTVNDIYELTLATFMNCLYNKQLPDGFLDSFTKINVVHKYQTWQTESPEYFLPRLNKVFGKKQLTYRGAELWGKLHPDLRTKHCIAFKKEMKLSIQFWVDTVIKFILEYLL